MTDDDLIKVPHPGPKVAEYQMICVQSKVIVANSVLKFASRVHNVQLFYYFVFMLGMLMGEYLF